MSDLPRSTPAEQGVDARGIDAFVAGLEPLPDVELHSLMVLRHGHVVAEQWWHPYRPDTPHLLYSLSKSFTSAAIGFAVAEGLVDLDAPALSYFPEYDARVTDPRSRSTLVRHLAAMASGHESERVAEAWEAGEGDLVLGLFLLPPEREPGSHFAYNQPCTYILGAIVRKVSGVSLTEFLRPRLFEPLGIEPYGWWTDESGAELGYSGLHTVTESVAKFGQLLLDGGVWQGKQLLPAEWVAEATRSHVSTAGEPAGNPDWEQGYGFQFWRARHGYRGDGAYGQFMVVLPEADAVVAITSQSPDMQAVLDKLWEHLLPALTAEEGPAGPWVAAARELARPAGDGSTAEIAEATFRPGSDNQVDVLTAVQIRPGELTLDNLTIALGGPDAWTVTGPYATAYAWSSGTLLLDVIFVENPHRIHLTLDPAAGTFAARWQTEPLSLTSADRLRMPR
jgi:CubicO group peptidase (beta-lactamase class C family)